MAGQAFSILSNLPALRAQQELGYTNTGLNKTLNRLSTGRRIVDSSDDAAGLSIANSLKANSLALQQANRNANDGIAIAQVADGALNQVNNLLLRCVTLATQAASDIIGDDEKSLINGEFNEILKEIGRVLSVTNFNGSRLLSVAGAKQTSVFVGDTHFQSYITISIGSSQALPSSFTDFLGPNIQFMDCDSGCSNGEATADTAATMEFLNDAIGMVNEMRGAIGAQQNRLVNAASILQVQDMNIRAAESMITDANMATEIMNMTKFQILAQAGASSLAQANASSQLVLQLMR
ncbi:MAG: flagellin FliC [bacterium]|nr:flagellin FliC [bacterium]